MTFFHDTVTRLRAPITQDAHGNEIRDWDNPDSTLLERLNVQPNSQDDTDTALRTSVITSWRLQSAPGVDLDLEATDRVVYGGVVCEVVGEVARWSHPLTGQTHHVETTIRRRKG